MRSAKRSSDRRSAIGLGRAEYSLSVCLDRFRPRAVRSRPLRLAHSFLLAGVVALFIEAWETLATRPTVSIEETLSYLIRARAIFEQGIRSTSTVSSSAAGRGAKVVSAFVDILRSPKTDRRTLNEVVDDVVSRLSAAPWVTSQALLDTAAPLKSTSPNVDTSTLPDPTMATDISMMGGASFPLMMPSDFPFLLTDEGIPPATGSVVDESGANGGFNWLADEALLSLLWQG